MVNARYRCLFHVVSVFFIMSGVVVGTEKIYSHFFYGVDFMVGVKCVVIMVHVVIGENDDFLVFFVSFIPLS